MTILEEYRDDEGKPPKKQNLSPSPHPHLSLTHCCLTQTPEVPPTFRKATAAERPGVLKNCIAGLQPEAFGHPARGFPDIKCNRPV